MTDNARQTEASTESVENLYHATHALLIALKEEGEPVWGRVYIEGVEDALADIEEQTGWEAKVEAEIERQIEAAR